MVNRDSQGSGGDELDLAERFRAAATDTFALTDRANEYLIRLRESIADPAAVDVAVDDFIGRMSLFDLNSIAGREVAPNAYRVALRYLFGAGHVDKAVAVVVSVQNISCQVNALGYLEFLAYEQAGVDTTEASQAVEDLVLGELDSTSPERSLELLRGMRRAVFRMGDSAIAHSTLQDIDRKLAERIGVGYNSVQDWASHEAVRYPSADWQAVAAIIQDDSLWDSETPKWVRMFVGRDLAMAINMIPGNPKFNRSLVNKMEESFRAYEERYGKTAGQDYMNAMLAVALFNSDQDVFAKSVMRFIGDQSAIAYVAKNLIPLDKKSEEAKRISLSLTDYRLVVDLLVDGSWPESADIQKLIHQLTTLHGRRTQGGKGPVISIHPIELRTGCMRALADRLETEGDVLAAEKLRKDATLLTQQQERGFVKYKPKKP